jgi:peptidoglycan/xylan/chitin deacetylase (PgdA/CDA1 family)
LKSRFAVIGADKLDMALASGKGQYVLITFDDGYRDNYLHGFPILKQHGVPATFFIATGFIDNPRLTWWDEIAWMVRTSRKAVIDLPGWLPTPVRFDKIDLQVAIRILTRRYAALDTTKHISFLEAIGKATGTGRYDRSESKTMWMTWDMIREMRGAGMSIGGHTVNHPLLAKLSRDEQKKEIVSCGRRLVEEIGEPMHSFSYPFGAASVFNSETRECLREAGVRFAFSYYGGFRRFTEWDEYDIRRLAVESFRTLDWFKATVELPNLFK